MNEVKPTSFLEKLQRTFRKFGQHLKRSWKKALRHFTKWIDPKLEPYRNKSTKLTEIIPRPPLKLSSEDLSQSAKPSDIPQTRADLLATIESAPLGIFTKQERKILETTINLSEIKVAEIMQPAEKIVYIEDEEVMGPITLDRLYHTGFQHFPVINVKKEIIGLIHTPHLNALEIRDSKRAVDILDPKVYYARVDYNLSQILDTFLRTNAYVLLIVSKYGRIMGFIELADFCKFLFGRPIDIDFTHDNDRQAVAKRNFPIEITPPNSP